MVYKLEIRSENFESETICMGWQLAAILSVFREEKFVRWLVFDVYGSTHGNLQQLFEMDESGNVIFPTTENLISSVDKIIQFETGVFCLVSDSEKIEFEDGKPETEAPEGIQIKNSLLEIRTFDYSFFEVYSNDKKYLENIKSVLLSQDNLSYEKK